MKTNILGAIITMMDSHVSWSMSEIIENVKIRLNETYGKYWTVVIYKVGKV